MFSNTMPGVSQRIPRFFSCYHFCSLLAPLDFSPASPLPFISLLFDTSPARSGRASSCLLLPPARPHVITKRYSDWLIINPIPLDIPHGHLHCSRMSVLTTGLRRNHTISDLSAHKKLSLQSEAELIDSSITKKTECARRDDIQAEKGRMGPRNVFNLGSKKSICIMLVGVCND